MICDDYSRLPVFGQLGNNWTVPIDLFTWEFLKNSCHLPSYGNSGGDFAEFAV